jgi:hypothetical protein
MSLTPLGQNKEGQFGDKVSPSDNLGKCESYKSEQNKEGQFGDKVSPSDNLGKCESYKSEQNKEDLIDCCLFGDESEPEYVLKASLAHIVKGEFYESEQNKEDQLNEKVILSDIDEICEILESFSDQTKDTRDRRFALDLFSKINKIGLISPNKDIYSKYQKNKRIKELLIKNFEKIRNILIRFPDILFYDLYYPETVCELRSGIEVLFNFWGDLVCENKKLKELFDPEGSRISALDASIKNWLEDLENYKPNIPEKIHENHWWWQELSKLQTVNTNQPTSAIQGLAS